jgi:uncharacterized repeat protein (TIGR01451 family)
VKKIIILLTAVLLVATVAEAALSLSVGWVMSTETLRPDSQAVLTLTFTNAGLTEITNVFVEHTAGAGLKIISDPTLEVGALASGASQQTSTIIKANSDAQTSNTYVLLDITYYSGTTEYTKSITVPVQIRRYPILQIENVDYGGIVEPGKSVNLSFDIVNVGEGSAKYLKISLGQSDVFSTQDSGGEMVIQSLDPYASQNIKFPIIIDPDASVGINSIPVVLAYQDEARINNYTQNISIGLTVTGEADFVASVDSGTNYYYGVVGLAEITISNKGSGPAEFVTVKASSDHGSKEFYIGSLDVDDSETIDLLQDLRGVSGKYPITLEISYRDKFQNSYSVTKVVDAMPTTAPTDYTTIIIIAVVVIVGIWYYRRKKRKK